MKEQDLNRQLLNITDTKPVYELQVTGESAGNPSFGIPTKKTIKRHELKSSHLIKKVREEWIASGIALPGDVTLQTAEQLTLTNQIENDGITYDIISQIDATSYTGTNFLYILRRLIGDASNT